MIVDLVHIKNCKEQREGHMHETNWIFEQTPSSHFCLKVVRKKGDCVDTKLRGIEATCTVSGDRGRKLVFPVRKIKTLAVASKSFCV